MAQGKNIIKLVRSENRIAVASNAPDIKVLSFDSNYNIIDTYNLRGHRMRVLELIFSKCSEKLYSTGSDGTICIFDIKSQNCIKSLNVQEVLNFKIEISSLALNNDTGCLIFAGNNACIYEWEHESDQNYDEKILTLKTLGKIKSESLQTLSAEKIELPPTPKRQAKPEIAADLNFFQEQKQDFCNIERICGNIIAIFNGKEEEFKESSYLTCRKTAFRLLSSYLDNEIIPETTKRAIRIWLGCVVHSCIV